MKAVVRIAIVLVISLLSVTICVHSAQAIETEPTSPTLTDGPFIITTYSFQGTNLRLPHLPLSEFELS
jgi:amino acid permease